MLPSLYLSLTADIQTHTNATQVWLKAFKIFLYIASDKRPLSLRPTWFRVEYQNSNEEPVVHVASVTCQTNWLGTENCQMLRRYILA
jgi:hypothetical protein